MLVKRHIYIFGKEAPCLREQKFGTEAEIAEYIEGQIKYFPECPDYKQREYTTEKGYTVECTLTEDDRKITVVYEVKRGY